MAEDLGVAATAAMLAANVRPLVPYPGRREPWKCECLACGAEVFPTIAAIAEGRSGCRACTARRNARRLDPTVAVEEARAAGLEPQVPFPGTGKPWPCVCQRCGQKVTPRLDGIRRSGSGCRYCAIKERAARKVLPAAEAVATMRAAGAEPLEEYRTVDTPWLCRCLRCGRETRPCLKQVRAGAGVCRYCGYANRRMPTKVPPHQAHADAVAAGLEPVVPYPGYGTPWLCRCTTCRAEVTPTLASIRSGHGCSACAAYGLNRGTPAWLYVLTHPKLCAHKLGVTGAQAKRDRLAQHARLGWILHEKFLFSTGLEAEAVEQAVLAYVRQEYDNDIPITREQMPQGGHTETITASRTFPVGKLGFLVRLVVDMA